MSEKHFWCSMGREGWDAKKFAMQGITMHTKMPIETKQKNELPTLYHSKAKLIAYGQENTDNYQKFRRIPVTYLRV